MKLFNHILLVFFILSFGVAKAQFTDIPSPYTSPITAYENQGNTLLIADKGDSVAFTDLHANLRWVNETGTIATSERLRAIAGEDSIFNIRALSQTGQLVYVVYSVYVSGFLNYRMARYDTSSHVWTRLTNTFGKLQVADVAINQMKAFDNYIYLGGRYYSSSLNQLLLYNPGGDSLAQVLSLDSNINQLQILDGELYVSGPFRQVSGQPKGGVIKFQNNTTWVDAILGDSFDQGYQYYTRLTQNFDAAYKYGSSLLNTFDKDGKNEGDITGNLNLTSVTDISSLAYFDDRIWVTSNAASGVAVYNATTKNWTAVNSSHSGDSKLEKIGNSLILIQVNSTQNLQRFTSFGPVIKGNVYLDLNKNCQRDAGEPGLKGKTVFEKAGKWAAITDENGEFTLLSDTGMFYMDTLAGLFNMHKVYCGSDSLIVDGTVDTVYYKAGYVETNPGQSVKLSLNSYNGFRARQGFTESVELVLDNQGIGPVNCKYTIRIPDDFHLISLNQNISDSSGKDYSFNLGLLAGEVKRLELKVKVPVNAPSLQFRKFFLFADSNCINVPQDSLKLQVRGAHDPNDKQCSEDGLMARGTKILKYHIRFQNVGTDTAYRVTILDTIDRNLPINYIKIRKASHPYTTKVLHEKGSPYYTLKFTFDNIMLPDSTTNEEKSHGYIQYETSIRSGFGEDDTIFNKAYIFFDYQPAIITNNVATSWDTLGSGNNGVDPRGKLDDLIVIFPNPVSDELTILNDLYRPVNFTIYDSHGKIVGYSYVGPKGKSSFTTSTLPAGIYYMQSPDGLIKKRFMIMRAQ